MSYKIPDFSTPLEPKEAQRLKKYCINACSFILTKFLYSKQQTVDFLIFKKRIPETITVYKNSQNKEQEGIQKESRETIEYPILHDVFEELEEKEIFNDKEFAMRKAESYMFRKKGVTFIRRELLAKKFEPEIVESVIAELLEENEGTYNDSFRLAADSITRKSNFLRKEPNERKKMFITTLTRKGYDMSDIFELTTDEEYAHLFTEE